MIVPMKKVSLIVLKKERKDALEKLSDLGYQFATDLLDYRRAKKLAESIESVNNIRIVHKCSLLNFTPCLKENQQQICQCRQKEHM